MNVLKKKWKELVYSLSTEDHYAEYNPNETPSFNMGRRVNQGNPVSASRVHLNSNDELRDEEMNIGLEEEEDINIDELGNTDNEGVSEALLAWRHIDSWTTEHNPDLNATLGDPCTHNDITHAEEDLAITFPAPVRVSLRIHDGQEDLESMTGVSGLIYGLQLMTLDQIVEMTEKWRSVAKNLNKSVQANYSASPAVPPMSDSLEEAKRRQFKLPHIPVQSSIPKGAIQPVYAHPAWIPLLTDNAGNHVGVDLAPASTGKYAQVIIFGRDFDTKFVVANNWGDFLLEFANDLEAGNWYLVDDNDDFFSGDGELVYRDKKSNGQVQDYLEVLKKRAWIRAQELQKEQQTQEMLSSTASKDHTQVNKDSLTDEASLDEDQDIVTTKDPSEVDVRTQLENVNHISAAETSLEGEGEVERDGDKASEPKVAQEENQARDVDSHEVEQQLEDAEKEKKIEKIKDIASAVEKDHDLSVKEDVESKGTGVSPSKEDTEESKREELKGQNAENSAEDTEDAKVKALKEEFESVAL